MLVVVVVSATPAESPVEVEVVVIVMTPATLVAAVPLAAEPVACVVITTTTVDVAPVDVTPVSPVAAATVLLHLAALIATSSGAEEALRWRRVVRELGTHAPALVHHRPPQGATVEDDASPG